MSDNSVVSRRAPVWGGLLLGAAGIFVQKSGGVDYAAAGLSWRLGDRFFLRPGIGVAVHDGRVGKFQVGNDLNLGSRVLAELELGAGWQFDPRTSIEATIVHMSHGQLAGHQNPGLDDVDLRLSHRF